MAEIVLPRLGWTMEQGVFMGWLKHDGESVKAGEPLFSVEGDKAVQEIEAIASGTVRIAADGPKEGDTIPVGTVIGQIEETSSIPEGSQKLANRNDPGAIADEPPGLSRWETDRESPTGTSPVARDEIPLPTGIAVTPRARKAARECDVELDSVTGTGRNGRIRERDILGSSSAAPTHRASPLRQVIAQRMVQSLRTTAPVTLTTLVDAENLVNLRGQFKTAGGIVPSFTDFIIKLTALALQKHPDLNARWTDDGIVTLPDIHIGLAVDTPAGLLVPVVKNVPSLTLRQLAARTTALIEGAKTRTLKPEEMQGGTFTITNLGAFGIDAFTPIINHPECAILGLGEIRKQPMVVGDQIVARSALTLSLTFDHRIVDGAPAARFLKTLRSAVENPSAWLLD